MFHKNTVPLALKWVYAQSAYPFMWTATKRAMRKKAEEKQALSVELEESSSNAHDKVKFEVYGEEMLEKTVKSSGNSGRIYLPPDWIGHRVKIIRID